MTEVSTTFHSTAKTKIKNETGEGWEFTCCSCSYRARYFFPVSSDHSQLEIVSLGDVHARHTSDENMENIVMGVSDEANEDNVVEENWLTPDILHKLTEILRGFED